MSVIRVPAGKKTYLFGKSDVAGDTVDVTRMVVSGGAPGPIRIPAGAQAILDARRDSSSDTFDIVNLTIVPAAAAPSGAWGDWALDEASGSRSDSSGNGHTLTAGSGGVGSDTGHDGLAAKFVSRYSDGEYLECTAPDLTGDQKWDLIFYIHITHDSGDTALFNIDVSADYAGGFSVGFRKQIGETDYRLEVISNDAHDADAGAVVTQSAWHKVRVYYDQVGLYVELDDTEVASSLGTIDAPDGIGTILIYQSGVHATILLDQLKLWVGNLSTD